jgi:hypothetical protein
MRKITAVSFKQLMGLLFLFSQTLTAQTNEGKFSVLVAEYEENSNINLNQAVVRYDFEKGEMVRKEKLISVSTKKRGSKEDYVRFDLATNTLYKNRYIVAGNGPIVDIQTGKVVMEEKAQLVKCANDSIVFYTNDIFKGKYYSYYNTITNTYQKIENLSYKPLLGQDVEVDYSSTPFKIYYYPIGAEKKLLIDNAGFVKKDKLKIPTYWLDNDNFIYPNYSNENGENIVTLYKVNVKKGKEKIASAKIDLPLDSAVNPLIYKNAANELVFASTPTAKYVISLKEKKMTWQESENIGNGFTISLNEYRTSGRSIKYQGQEIGNYYCDYNRTKTANNIIVVPFEIVFKNEKYAQGIIVWNKDYRKWKSVDNPSVLGVIGIIEK